MVWSWVTHWPWRAGEVVVLAWGFVLSWRCLTGWIGEGLGDSGFEMQEQGSAAGDGPGGWGQG